MQTIKAALTGIKQGGGRYVRRLQRKQIDPFVYKVTYSRYQGQIPFLSESRESFEKLLLFLIQKVIDKRYDRRGGLLRLTRAPQVSWSGRESDRFELLARTFGGLSFFLAHNDSPRLMETYRELILNVFDPRSAAYAGRIASNQILVENAFLMTAFMAVPRLWGELGDQGREWFSRYIEYCTGRNFVFNNWQWFKVFHFLFLDKFEGQNRGSQINDVLEDIERFYVGDGWYRDGLVEQELRYDNYNAWIFYSFGLLFCRFAPKEYDPIKEKIKNRFLQFKKYQMLCYGEDGLPLFWGRSKLYRFAGLSCFGPAMMLDLLDEDEMAWLRNRLVGTVNRFLREGILDRDGFLTMGYTSPRPEMLERYSGEGSPYFIMLVFSVLLLPKNHPFWQPQLQKDFTAAADAKSEFSPALNLFFRTDDTNRFLLNGGMNSRVFTDKYNKFAYSSRFGEVIGNEVLDNLFIFYSKGKRFTRDTLIKASFSEPNKMRLNWQISGLPGFEAQSILVPSQDGYFLSTWFISPRELKFTFAGFNLSGSLMIRDQGKNYIQLKAGNAYSRMEIIGPPNGRFEIRRIPRNNNITDCVSVLPLFHSALSKGSIRVIFKVQAGCGQSPQVKMDLQGKDIVIRENSKEIFAAS